MAAEVKVYEEVKQEQPNELWVAFKFPQLMFRKIRDYSMWEAWLLHDEEGVPPYGYWRIEYIKHEEQLQYRVKLLHKPKNNEPYKECPLMHGLCLDLNEAKNIASQCAFAIVNGFIGVPE